MLRGGKRGGVRADLWTKKRADEILLFVRASLECLGSEDARV